MPAEKMPEQLSNNTLPSDNARIAKNTLYLYARMLITMAVGLVTARINFRALGIENYGLYNVVGSVILFFVFINTSLVTATRRYITAEIATGTPESSRNVFNLALISHGLIALIVLVLAETVGLYLVNHTLNIPEGREFAAKVVYQFTVLTALWQIFQAPYTAVITAYEKMNIYAYLSIVDVVFKLLVAFVTYYYPGDKLIAFAFMIFLSGFVNIGLTRLYCIRKFPESCFARPHNRNLLKEMFTFMGWSLFGQAAVVGTNQGVTFLINVFFSVAANAAMGVSNQITNIVNSFVTNFQVAFNPQITKLYVKKDYENLINLAIRSSRMTSFLVMFFMIPIIFQVNNFLTIWLGDYPEYAVEFVIYTLLAIYLETVAAPFWMINYSDTNLRSYQIGSAVIFSFCFILGWVALKMGFPPYSVVIVRAFVMGLMIPYRLYMVKEKVITFPIFRWFRETLFQSFVVMIFPCSLMFYINRLSYSNIYAEFISNSVICACLVCSSIYMIGLTVSERNFINEKVKSIIHIRR